MNDEDVLGLAYGSPSPDTLPEPALRPGDPGYKAALKAAFREAGWAAGRPPPTTTPPT